MHHPMKTKCPQVALLEFRCRNKNFSTSIIVPFLLKLCSPHIKNFILGCTCFYCKLIIHWHMVIIMYGRNNHPLFFSSAVGLSTSFSLYHVFNFFAYNMIYTFLTKEQMGIRQEEWQVEVVCRFLCCRHIDIFFGSCFRWKWFIFFVLYNYDFKL